MDLDFVVLGRLVQRSRLIRFFLTLLDPELPAKLAAAGLDVREIRRDKERAKDEHVFRRQVRRDRRAEPVRSDLVGLLPRAGRPRKQLVVERRPVAPGRDDGRGGRRHERLDGLGSAVFAASGGAITPRTTIERVETRTI